MKPNPNLHTELRASLESAFRNYQEESMAFFDYLNAQSARGLSRSQFAAYRDNYLYRTTYTAVAVKKVVDAAVRAKDHFGIDRAQKNLDDETGGGQEDMRHPVLMQHSYDTHGRIVYQLTPAPQDTREQSPYLLEEARAFRRLQEQSYGSPSYLTVLGTSFAQESAARQMLECFYEDVFLPRHKVYASADDFYSVARYFLVHINGLEEKHAGDALEVLMRACRSESDAAVALDAAQTFWKAQSNLWRAMHQQLAALV